MKKAVVWYIAVSVIIAASVAATAPWGVPVSPPSITLPSSSTINDVVAFGNTTGTSFVDTGIPQANVVLTSRQMIAGTGITVTPQQQLTSDITVGVSNTQTFYGGANGNSVTVPVGLSASWQMKDSSGAVLMDISATADDVASASGTYNIGVQTRFVNFIVLPGSGTAIFVKSGGDILFNGSNSTADIQNSNTAGVRIQGTSTNDSAPAGDYGEYFSTCIAVGNGVALTTATTANVTSQSVTSGNWILNGSCGLNGNLTGTDYQCGISTVSATMPGASSKGDTWNEQPTVSASAADDFLVIPSVRTSNTSSTTYYLVIQATFTVGSAKGFGCLKGFRPR